VIKLKTEPRDATTSERQLYKTQSYELKVNSKVDIYHPEQKEILLFDDGIQVKEPKAKRRQGLGEKRQGTVKTPAVVTDVVLLQRATVGFEYIAAQSIS